MRIDSLTHILPRYFAEHRSHVVGVDRTFAELFGSSPNAKIGSVEELLASMDESEIDVSVVAGFGWTELEIARPANDYLLDSIAAHPDRLVALCSVNPLWGEAALEEAAHCLDSGARGIGELHADTQGWRDRFSKELDDLMSLVAKRDGVVLVHGSEPLGHEYPGKGTMTPDRLHALARRYPDNRFVFSHFGGGLPWHAMMPECGSDLPNVWYDSAAAPFLYDPNVYGATVAATGTDRLMFASDWPLISQPRALRHLNSDDNLSVTARDAICGGNSAELFGIASR